MDNSRILVIPDMHLPYCHPDTFDFLYKIKKLLQPTRIICLGDELDYHAMSFHDKDVDLDSAGKELLTALGYIDTLHDLFPKMDLLESNHGSLVYRKAKHHGFPRHVLKSYNEVLGVSTDDWRWHDELILELPNGKKCKFVHGVSGNILAASQLSGMSMAQGHHHSLFECRYWDGGDGRHFAITSGCLIDKKSYAFAYGKLFLKKPQLGVTFIEDSIPQLIPMNVDENNRWTGTRI